MAQVPALQELVPLHKSVSPAPQPGWGPFPRFGCVQVASTPLQWSAVQGFLSSVHAVALDLTASIGHAVEVPLQASATSHSPAASRHKVPRLPAGCWHVFIAPLH